MRDWGCEEKKSLWEDPYNININKKSMVLSKGKMAIFSIEHKGNSRLRLFEEKKKDITMSFQKMKKRVKCPVFQNGNFSLNNVKWQTFSRKRERTINT